MISVAMVTYNGMPYVRQQVASILCQLDEDDELIISDNGSTDGTWNWLQNEAVSDKRIRPLYYIDQQGIVANVAHALSKCSGELIFLSDQDDIWLPDRVRTMSQLFADDPDLLLVQADAEIIDNTGQVIGSSFFELRHCGPGIIKNLYKNTWQGCSICCRSRLIELVLPFPQMLPMHDMWLGLVAELYGHVQFLPVILLQHRRHDHNQSSLRRSHWFQVMDWRLRLATALAIKMLQSCHDHRLIKKL